MRRCRAETDGYHAYEFVADKLDIESDTVIMAWTVTGGARQVSLPVSFAGATVTDMLGSTERADVIEGDVEAQVGPYPIYVTAAPTP